MRISLNGTFDRKTFSPQPARGELTGSSMFTDGNCSREQNRARTPGSKCLSFAAVGTLTSFVKHAAKRGCSNDDGVIGIGKGFASMFWTDPNPVFIDIETQSAAQLKECGGRAYAADPTTRILSLVARIDGVYHIWIPSYISAPSKMLGLWPTQLGPEQPIELYHTDYLPAPIAAAANAGRTFIAHNAWGFDQFIWREKIAGKWYDMGTVDTPPFLDSMPIARAAGLAGGLEKVSKSLFGGEKDKGKLILKKYWAMKRPKSDPVNGELYYPIPGPGDIAVIARYNIADVALLAMVWDTLDVEVEADVLDAHCAINERGVKIDQALTLKIQQVSGESVGRAANKIAQLTNGRLTVNNIRSAAEVKKWLGEHGLRILSYALDDQGQRKQSLRKDLVEQALANPWMMLDDDVPVEAAKDIDPVVFEVLRLRGASLRITAAKADRAILRSGADGRARDLFTYWTAHTGRWSSAGIQVHNLPRAKKGVPIEKLLDMHASGEWAHGAPIGAYDKIEAILWAGATANPPLGVDDALAALLRPIFIADAGKVFLIADYNAIECRCIAWMANDENLLSIFREGRDPYREMAARIFGVEINAVSDSQRQIGKVVVLGCGYGMGVEKFRIYCGLQGVNLESAGTTAEVCIDSFRQAFPAIAGRWRGQIGGRAYRAGGVWDQLGSAAQRAIADGGTYHAGRCVWMMHGDALICELPSGRKLRYRGARIEDRVPGYAIALGLDKTKATIVYDGLRGDTVLYGAKAAENVSQAICRDVMATALVRHEAAGFPVVVDVHDEIVAEVDINEMQDRIGEFAKIMATPPAWAEGFPIKVEAYAARRYLKKDFAWWPKASAAF